MKKRIISLIGGMLLLAGVVSAQSLPNRSTEVASLVTGKYAGQLNGQEDRRREVLSQVCGDLNLIDGGRWGLLIKSDRNPPFIPSDILVWAPTREHVDVLTDSGPAWIVHEAIPSQWNWQVCPTAGPVVGVLPVVTPGQPPAPIFSNEALQRIITIEQVVAEIRQQNAIDHAAIRADIAEAKTTVKDAVTFISKYILPSLGAVIATWQVTSRTGSNP